MGLVHERYADFGPTLACEKLVEQHGYRLIVKLLVEKVIVSLNDIEVRLRPNGIERLALEFGQTLA